MIRKICKILSTILLAMLALVAAVLIIPNFFGCKGLAVLTGSMEPKIGVGTLVYIKEVEPDTLEIGDVITYRISKESLVTHRVTENNENEKYVITKGDANDAEDGMIPYDALVGKEMFYIPKLGYVSMYIKTPLGIGVGCGILVIIILLTFLPDVLEPNGNESEKESKDSSEISKKK